MTRLLSAALILVAFSALPAQAQDANYILTGGRVWTGLEDRPWAEAVAVRGERILAVGR